MSKTQTRRSISVRGSTYAQLREHCAGASISMSDFVEQRIAEFFAGQQPAQAARPVATPPPRVPAKVAVARPPVARPEVERPAPRASLARPVPVRSAVALKRPVPTVAARVVSAPAPSKGNLPGRPAPTPARQVIRARPASSDSGDYRAIRF